MNGIRASQRFEVMSKRLGSRLREHAQETFPPDAQKGLRRFAMREAAELLRINQNTFRHHVSNLEGFPEGVLEGGNRRSFSADEMVEAQRVLLETGRIKPEEHPHRRPGEACQVLTIFNLKGGSAKTSSVAHVGQLLGLRGYRVLLIDLDSQASLTNLFGVTPELDPDMPTSYDLIRSDDPLPAAEIIRKTNFPTVDLIPASMDIMEYEFEVALSFRHGATTFHSRIREALEPVLNRYDVVIFDTPPQLNFSVISALFASTGVLIPLKRVDARCHVAGELSGHGEQPDGRRRGTRPGTWTELRASSDHTLRKYGWSAGADFVSASDSPRGCRAVCRVPEINSRG